MSANPQTQQLKQNILNHPYTQQAQKFVSGQVNSLDVEVSISPSRAAKISDLSAQQVSLPS
jgi:hypothetical protein